MTNPNQIQVGANGLIVPTLPAWVTEAVKSEPTKGLSLLPLSVNPLNDSTVSGETNRMSDNYMPLDEPNWWNSLMNSIDETDKSILEGKRIKKEAEIAKLRKSINSASPETQPLLIENLKTLQNDIVSIDEKIRQQDEDIATSPVDKLYKHHEELSRLEGDHLFNDPIDWLKYQSGTDIGSNFALIGSTIGATIASMGAKWLVKQAAKRAVLGGTVAAAGTVGSGGVGAPVAAIAGTAVTVASLIADIGTLAYARYQETKAEVGEAAKQKKAKLIADKERQLGRPLTESEYDDVVLETTKGLEVLEAKNYSLATQDLVNNLLFLSPWTKALKGVSDLNRYTRLGAKAAGVGGSILTEGVEEGLQWKFQKDYLEGTGKVSDILKDVREVGSNVLGLSDTIRDKEFESAVNAGMSLGGLFGGASNVAGIITDEYNYRKAKTDLDNAKIQALDDLYKETTDTVLFKKYFIEDRVPFLREQLSKLSKMPKSGIDDAGVREALQYIDNAEKEYNAVNNLFSNSYTSGLVDLQDKEAAFKNAMSIVRGENNLVKLQAAKAEYIAQNKTIVNSLFSTGDINAATNLTELTPFDVQIAEQDFIIRTAKEELAQIAATGTTLERATVKKLMKEGKVEVANYLSKERSKITELKKADYIAQDVINRDNAEVISKLSKNTPIEEVVNFIATTASPIDERVKAEVLRRIEEENKLNPYVTDEVKYTNDFEGLGIISDEQAAELAALELKTNKTPQEVQEMQWLQQLKEADEVRQQNDDYYAGLEHLYKTEEPKEKKIEDLKGILKNRVEQPFSKEIPIEGQAKFNYYQRQLADSYISNIKATQEKLDTIEDYDVDSDALASLEQVTYLKKVFEGRPDVLAKPEFTDYMSSLDKAEETIKEQLAEITKRRADKSAKQVRIDIQNTSLLANTLGIDYDGVVNNEEIHSKILEITGNDGTSLLKDYRDTKHPIYLQLLFRLYKERGGTLDIYKPMYEEAKATMQTMLALGSGIIGKNVALKGLYSDTVEKFFDSPIKGMASLVKELHLLYKRDAINPFTNFANNEDIEQLEKELAVEQPNPEHYVSATQFLEFLQEYKKVLVYDKAKSIFNSIVSPIDIVTREQEVKNLIAPSYQQRNTIHQAIYHLTSKFDKSKPHAGSIYIKGAAGTGKTKVVLPWIFNILNVPSKNIVVAVPDVFEEAAKIAGSSLNTKGVPLSKLQEAVTADTEYIVIDEASYLPDAALKGLSETIVELNKTRSLPIRVVYLGDPNQMTDKGQVLNINRINLVNIENQYNLPSLSIPYRTSVSAIADYYDRFKGYNDPFSAPFTVKSNVANPKMAKGSLAGVYGTINFNEDAIATLKNANLDDGKTRLVIVSNEEELRKMRSLLDLNGLNKVEVRLYINAQGITRDEVYLNITPEQTGLKGYEFKSAVYTMASRATTFLMVNDPRARNLYDESLTNSPVYANEDIEKNASLYKERVAVEREAIKKYESLFTIQPKQGVPDTAAKVKEDVKSEPPVIEGDDANDITEEELDTPDVTVVEDNTTNEEASEVEEDVLAELESNAEVNELGEPVISSPVQIARPIIKLESPTNYATVPQFDVIGNQKIRPIKPNDPVIVIKRKAGKKVLIELLSPAFTETGEDTGYYRQIGVLTESEVERFPEIKKAVVDNSIPFTEFAAGSDTTGLIKLNKNRTNVLFTSSVLKASPITYKYSPLETSVKKSLNDILDIFKMGFFDASGREEASSDMSPKVVIFSNLEDARKVMPKDAKVFLGTPYLLIEPKQKNSKKPSVTQYIRLAPRKLNLEQDGYIFEPIKQFLGLVDRLEQYHPEFAMGNQYFYLLMHDVEADRHIIYNSVNIPVEQQAEIEAIIAEIKTLSGKRKDAEGNIIKGPLDEALNKLARMNPTINYTDSKGVKKKATLRIRQQVGAKTLIVSKSPTAFSQNLEAMYSGLMKQLNQYNKANNTTKSRLELTKEETEEMVRNITDSVTNPNALSDYTVPKEVLQELIKFDDNGVSIADTGTGGLRFSAPLSRYRFDRLNTQSTVNHIEEDFENVFEEVIPTEVSIEVPSPVAVSKSEDDIDLTSTSLGTSALDDLLSGLDDISFKLGQEPNGKRLTRKEVIKLVKKVFGNNITEAHVRAIDFATMFALTGKKDALGFYQKGVITLLDNLGDNSASLQVLRHEIFHKIVRQYLTASQRATLFNEVRVSKNNTNLSDIDCEEILADMYMSTSYTLSQKIVNFFKSILEALGIFARDFNNVKEVFRLIDQGYYSSVQPVNDFNNDRVYFRNFDNWFTLETGESKTLAVDRYRVVKSYLIEAMNRLMNEGVDMKIGNQTIKYVYNFEEAINIIRLQLEKLSTTGIPKDKPLVVQEAMGILTRAVVRDGNKTFPVLNTLLEQMYPNNLAKIDYGYEFEETENGEIPVQSENSGLQDEAQEKDTVNHETKLSIEVKAFFSTIFTTINNVKQRVNPRFAYVRSLYLLTNVDFSKSATEIKEQIKVNDNAIGSTFSDKATAVKVALFKTIDEAFTDIAYPDNYSKDSTYYDMVTTSFVINSKEYKTGKTKTPSTILTILKDEPVLDAEFLHQLYRKAVASDLLANMYTNTGSLRKKNLYVGVKTTEYGKTTYKYMNAKEFSASHAAKGNIISVLVDNYNTVTEEQLVNLEKGDVATFSSFFVKNGLSKTNFTPSSEVEQASKDLAKIIRGLKAASIDDYDTYLSENFGGILNRLSGFISVSSGDSQITSFFNTSKKKVYGFHNSSFGIDTISKIINTGKFYYYNYLSLPFYKENIFHPDNKLNKIYDYVDHDGIREGTGRATQFARENDNDFFVRSVLMQFASIASRGKKTFTYMQPTYPVSDKPQSPAFRVNLLNKQELEKAQEVMLNQPFDPADSKVGIKNKDNIQRLKIDDNKVASIVSLIVEQLNAGELRNKGTIDPVIVELYKKIQSLPEFELPTLNESALNNYKTIAPLLDIYVRNWFVNGYFLNQLVAGDQRIYKNDLDQVKRMSIAFAMGYKGIVNEDIGMRSTFKVLVNSDPQVLPFDTANPEYDEIKAYIRERQGIDIADAQGFMTPKRFLDIAKGFGSGLALAKILKPVYFGIDSKGIPRAIKYSSVVLDDEMVNRFPKLKEIRNMLEASNIDEYVFGSAFKVGQPNDMVSPEESLKEYVDKGAASSGVVTLSNEYWRIQFNPLTDADTRVTHPSQATYFVNTTGINTEQANKIWTAQADTMEKALNLFNKENSRILDAPNIKGTKRNKLLKTLTAAIVSTLNSPGSERMADILQTVGVPALNYPAIVSKGIVQLSSLIQSNITHIKYSGSKLALQSSYGVEVYEVDGKVRLYNELSEEEKKTAVPRPLKAMTLKDGKYDGTIEVILPNQYKNVLSEVTDREILDNPELVRLLGYRIPSTEMHSTVALKVVGFYDDKGTNVAITAAELSWLHGSDFDIDSLFIIRPFLLTKDIVDHKNRVIFKKGEKPNQADVDKAIEKAVSKRQALEASLRLSTDLTKSQLDDIKAYHKAIKKTIKSLELLSIETSKNEFLSSYLNLITSIDNIKSMLTPISMEVLNGDGDSVFTMLANKYTGKEYTSGEEAKKIINKPTNLNYIDDYIYSLRANLAGKELVGIFASAVKAIAYLQASGTGSETVHTPAKLVKLVTSSGDQQLSNTSFEFLGGTYDKLERYSKESKPRLITEIMDALVNASVDNVKEQILGAINATRITAPIMSFMVATGVPLNDVVLLTTQPVMWSLSQLKSASTTALNNLPYLKELKEKVKDLATEEELSTPLTKEDLDLAYSTKLKRAYTLKEVVESDNKALITAQYKVLLKYQELLPFANAITTTTTALKPLNDYPATIQDIEKVLEAVEYIKSDNYPFEASNFFNIPHIKVITDVLIKNYEAIKTIYHMHSKEVDEFLDSDFFPISLVSNSILDNDVPRRQHFKQELVKYLVASKEELNKANEVYTSNGVTLYGLRAFTARVVDVIKEVKKVKTPKGGTLGTENQFVKNLTPTFDKVTKLNGISFENANTSDLDFEQQRDIVNGFEELAKLELQDGKLVYNPDSIQTTSIVQNYLIQYAALTKGFEFGKTNYSLFIPPTRLVDIINYINSMGETVFRSSEYLNNLKEDFYIQYVANNPEVLTSSNRVWNKKVTQSKNNNVTTYSAVNSTPDNLEEIKIGVVSEPVLKGNKEYFNPIKGFDPVTGIYYDLKVVFKAGLDDSVPNIMYDTYKGPNKGDRYRFYHIVYKETTGENQDAASYNTAYYTYIGENNLVNAYYSPSFFTPYNSKDYIKGQDKVYAVKDTTNTVITVNAEAHNKPVVGDTILLRHYDDLTRKKAVYRKVVAIEEISSETEKGLKVTLAPEITPIKETIIVDVNIKSDEDYTFTENEAGDIIEDGTKEGKQQKVSLSTSAKWSMKLVKEVAKRAGIEIVIDTTMDIPGLFINGVARINPNHPKFGADTIWHEALAHPIVASIKSQNPTLYKELVNELLSNHRHVFEKVASLYSELSYQDQIEEAIVTLLGLRAAEIRETKESSLPKRLLQLLTTAFNWFRKLFTKAINVQPFKLSEKTTLNDIATLMELPNLFSFSEKFEGVYQQRSSIIEDITSLNAANSLEIPTETRDTYRINGTQNLKRLTYFIRDNFSDKKQLSLEEYEARKYFDQKGTSIEDGVVVFDDITFKYDDLVKYFKIRISKGAISGTIAHKIIQAQATKNRRYLDEARDLAEANEINIQSFNWLINDFETIMRVAGFENIFNSEPALKDEFTSELPVFNKDLQIGLQIDGVVTHANSSISIVDYKTGKSFFANQFYAGLMKYAENTNEVIKDSSLGKAYMQIALQALTLKLINPNVKFNKLLVHHLNKYNITAAPNSVPLNDMLLIIERYIRAERPELYDKYRMLGLFNAADYYFVPTEIERSNVTMKVEDELNQAKEALSIKTAELLDAQEKNLSVDIIAELKIQVANLFERVAQLEKFAGEDINQAVEDIGMWKRWLGNKYNISNPIVQLVQRLRERLSTRARIEKTELNSKHDKLLREVLNVKNTGVSNLASKVGLANYDKKALFDFMWVYRNEPLKGSESSWKGSGYYGKTIEEAKEELEKGLMTQQEFNYLEFVRTNMDKYNKEVLNQVILKKGKAEITKLQVVYGTNFEFGDDFMPRYAASTSEILTTEGLSGVKNKVRVKEKMINKLFVEEAKEKNYPIGLNVSGFGSSESIQAGLHTFDVEVMFKTWTGQLINKKYMDEASEVFKGAQTYLELKGRTPVGSPLTRTVNFLEETNKYLIQNIDNDGKLLRKHIHVKFEGKTYVLSARKLALLLKSTTSSMVMALNVIGGIANAGLMVTVNVINAAKGSIASSIGLDTGAIEFTLKDLVEASYYVFDYWKDTALGNQENNKTYNLMKKFGYSSDNFDYRTDKRKFVAANFKLFDTKILYAFHAIPEEANSIALMVATLKRMQFTNTEGKTMSMFDAYDNQGNWIGGVRGKTRENKTLAELTGEEIIRLKRVSQRIHGAYREDERHLMETHWVGQWMLQLRKYLPTVLENALQSSYLDQSLGYYKEVTNPDGTPKLENGEPIYEWQARINQGRTRLFVLAIRDTLRGGTYAYKNLDKEQQLNVLHAIMTISVGLGIYYGTDALMDDDDDETMLAFRMNRMAEDVTNEFVFMDAWKAFGTTSVTIREVLRTIEALWQMLQLEYTEDGVLKGVRSFYRSVPVVRSAYNVQRMAEELELPIDFGFPSN